MIEEDDDDVPFWKDGSLDDQLCISEQLSSDQQEQLRQLLSKFNQVLCNQPGQTQLAERKIETGSARPVRLPSYRLPHAYREDVQQELQEKLEQGIIEP